MDYIKVDALEYRRVMAENTQLKADKKELEISIAYYEKKEVG